MRVGEAEVQFWKQRYGWRNQAAISRHPIHYEVRPNAATFSASL
ncbi:MAG: hypothetical protein KGL02_08580 [Acidobacteriota bacterium]|nr:hypothetical protein [Acidobacteriota bacterium]MDE3169597.1 hypothetical protein [Acidobacteriota bacterium]